MKKLPAGTIFWVLLECATGKGDRMMLNRKPTSMEQYFRWLQKQRTDAEAQTGKAYVIVGHSIQKP